MSFLLNLHNSTYEYLSKELQKCKRAFYKIIPPVSLSAQMWLIMSFCSLPLSAGMQDNLEKAFGALGMSNNVTNGGGYQDQTGGFYTGGSVFA